MRSEKLIDALHFVKLQRETFNWPLFEKNVASHIFHPPESFNPFRFYVAQLTIEHNLESQAHGAIN
jgi:hypothetical protein